MSNLAVIGEISLLQNVYLTVLIPPIVHTELMRLPEIQSAIATCITSGWLETKTPNNLQLVQTLDPGEAAAVALAVELNADRLLINERLGRSIATQYGVKIRGILGTLVNAKAQALIPAVKPLLDRVIHEAGFRVIQTLYDRIIEEVGET